MDKPDRHNSGSPEESRHEHRSGLAQQSSQAGDHNAHVDSNEHEDIIEAVVIDDDEQDQSGRQRQSDSSKALATSGTAVATREQEHALPEASTQKLEHTNTSEDTHISDDALEPSDWSDHQERKSASAFETILLWVTLVASVATTAVCELLRIGGANSIEITLKQSIVSYFSPAGYTYSAWLIIVAALGLWACAQTARSASRDESAVHLSSIMFAVTQVTTVIWTLLWHVHLYSAALVGITAASALSLTLYASAVKEHQGWLRRVALGLFTGWTLAMNAVMVSHVAARYGDPHGRSPFWQIPLAILLMVIVSAICYALRQRCNEWAAGAVVLWCITGVGVQLMQAHKFIAVIMICAAVLCAFFIYLPWRKLIQHA